MKTLAIVQARMGSSRRPGKVMAPVCGRPLIDFLLARLALARRVSGILVATSTLEREEPLVAHLAAGGIEVFRGSEDDVLSRFADALRVYHPDVIVRITGDCPLVDPGIVDATIDAFHAGGVDYAANIDPPTYPDGLDVEVCAATALLRADAEARDPYDREHVTSYVRNSGRFRTLNVPGREDWSSERWTVDEPEDLEVVTRVFEAFAPRIDFSWREVLDLRQAHPEIFLLNRQFERNAKAH